MPPKDDGSPRKDVSDWIEWLDSKTCEDLAAALVGMAEDAPAWTPEAQAEECELAAPVLICLADVKPEPVCWLWPERVAIGKLSLLVGDPDLGKSLITLDLAARVSTGDGWPDSPAATGTPGGVVLLSAEDDLADTVRPRLDAVGADTSRINALQTVKYRDPESGRECRAPFDLTRDLPVLEKAVNATADCRLVVIDPISAYLGRTDSHSNAEVRGLLAPLSELAARCDVALVAVTHLRKSQGPAIYRAMGSLGFLAAARGAYGVAKDKDDPTGQRRLFVRIKNNLTAVRTGLAYRIVARDGGPPAVAWDSVPVEVSADDVFGPAPPEKPGPDPQERSEAADWLRNALTSGPKPAKELLGEAKKEGISEGTLKRAKADLRVKAEKPGWAAGWVWRLPEVKP